MYFFILQGFMKRYYLSENEKYILKSIAEGKNENDLYEKLTNDEVYTYSKALQEYGLIHAFYAEGGEVLAMRIMEKGTVYLKENPNLENPFNDDELKRLQKDELEYKKRIRKYEKIILIYKVISIAASIVVIFMGWMLFFINKQ